MSGRTRVRLAVWQPGFAVRRDWTVDGTHEFVGFQVTEAEAGWFAVADRACWRRSPSRPLHTVVEISVRDFELHRERRGCRSPDCPGARVAPVVAGGEGVR